jgi:hypothetical protein
MRDDGVPATVRAAPGEQRQGERFHPGSDLSCGSGSAIKRITAGVKARSDRPLQGSDPGRAFTLPEYQVQTKKEHCVPRLSAKSHRCRTLAGISPFFVHNAWNRSHGMGETRQTAPKDALGCIIDTGQETKKEIPAKYARESEVGSSGMDFGLCDA